MLHPDRIFPIDPETRRMASQLFASVEKLPLICPHGHTLPEWFSENELFPDPAQLLIVPDHYVLRMLVSQGATLPELGIRAANEDWYEADGRKIWKRFADGYHFFRGTPVRIWFDHTLETLFGVEAPLTVENADEVYEQISECLVSEAFRPRRLYERFNIEVLATTDSCNDDLQHHRQIRDMDWQGKVIPTYRPDSTVDPDYEGFPDNVELLGALTGEDITSWDGYLNAHRTRRAYFKSLGATATDHGHPNALTADLDLDACQRLYQKVLSGKADAKERNLFRAQMLTEMAGMSVEDGLVMQLHPGSIRNHNDGIFRTFGRDKGFDIPGPADFVSSLKPLLNRYGMSKDLTLILFTLDETTYSRELAPLAGVYPALKLGPAWWFHDSPAGMMRYREQTTESAGFYNTAGFNDDTRAFPSILARHDLARRVDCSYLARLVLQHMISEEEAAELATELAYGLAKRAYRL